MSELSGSLDSMLSDRDLAVLNLAARTYLHEGAREQAAHDQLGMTATRFWQRANALCDSPDAYRAQPTLIKRLRRMRDQRQADRARRRLEPSR